MGNLKPREGFQGTTATPQPSRLALKKLHVILELRQVHLDLDLLSQRFVTIGGLLEKTDGFPW